MAIVVIWPIDSAASIEPGAIVTMISHCNVLVIITTNSLSRSYASEYQSISDTLANIKTYLQFGR